MDSDSFKSVIVCGQCGEWFGDMLSQVHHLTTHTFSKTTGSTVMTKSVLDFLQRCDRDAPDQSVYTHADGSSDYSFDKWSPSADDVLSDEKNGTVANNQASVSHQSDRLDIDGNCGESLSCNAQLHQVNCEGQYDLSLEQHAMNDIAGMGDHGSGLFRDGDDNSVHLKQTDQNFEYLSGCEAEVPETYRVLSSDTDEDFQDAVPDLSYLEHEDNESPCKFESRLEHQYDDSVFDVKNMSAENRNDSTNDLTSKICDGHDYISVEDNPGEIVNSICKVKLYQSHRGGKTRTEQMLNTNCQDGTNIFWNTGKKYSSVEGSINNKSGMDRSGSLWKDTQTDQTLSNSQGVSRSDVEQRHPDPATEDCLRIRGLNSTAKKRHVELSGEEQTVMVFDFQGRKNPPGNVSGSRTLPFDKNSLANKHTRGFKTSDITPCTVDIKPHSEAAGTQNSSQSLNVGVNTCSGVRSVPKPHFETDMNYNTKSVSKQFVEGRNQYHYVHGRSRPGRNKMLKNPNCQDYNMYKPHVTEDGHTGEPLAIDRQKCTGNTNEVIDTNNKSRIFESSVLFEKKKNDYIFSSFKQSDRWNYHHSHPVEQHSRERTKSGESVRKKYLGGEKSDHKCSVCGQMFEVPGDLQMHLISHKQQCHLCGERFEELEHLNAHLDMHLEDVDECCWGEGNQGQDLHHLSCDAEDPDHAVSQHDLEVKQANPAKGQQKNYRCEICSKLFVAKHTLRIHMNIHLGKRSTCPVCKQTFSTDWSVKRHAEKHHHKERVCEKSFSSPNSLKTQKAKTDIVQKEDKNLFTCEVCEREFWSIKSLNNHSRTHQNRVQELQQCVKTFRCTVCDCVYATPGSLVTHMKVHGDKYRHSCAVCFAGFPTLTELDTHMQQHTHGEEKLNTCSFCGRGFDLHSSLIQHIQQCRKTQQDTRGRVFENFMVFGRDKEKHSAHKRFQCPVCSKMYLSKKSLRHHMKVKDHIAPSDEGLGHDCP